MKINEIQNLIRFVAKLGVSEVELEMKDFTIKIKNSFPEQEAMTAAAPVFTTAMHTPPGIQLPVVPIQAEETSSTKEPEIGFDDSKYVTIKSPMIGTFYLTPATDKPPFVNIGDEVKKGQTLCIIEAMKLFNEIESEAPGKIIKILIDDASPAEYDTPLFLIDPS